MVENRFDHFDPEPLTLVEMGVVRSQTATNQFNLSSFFQGIPGNDGLPGNPGLPGYIVSKIRDKGGEATCIYRFQSCGSFIRDAAAQNEWMYQEVDLKFNL